MSETELREALQRLIDVEAKGNQVMPGEQHPFFAQHNYEYGHMLLAARVNAVAALASFAEPEQDDPRLPPQWLSDAVLDVATNKVVGPIPGPRAAELFAAALWPAIKAHIPAEPEQAADRCQRPLPENALSIGSGYCITHHGTWRFDRARCGKASLPEQADEVAGRFVERLREAARNVGMPHDVTVADIENLATEYARLAARDDRGRK